MVIFLKYIYNLTEKISNVNDNDNGQLYFLFSEGTARNGNGNVQWRKTM